jgi:plastocyanin
MKKILPILLTTTFLLLTITIKATIVVITQQDLTFVPNSTAVMVGDTVRWLWTSGVHTTTSTDIPAGAEDWNSPLTAEVTQYDYVVTVEGTYNYVCTPHAASGMTGSFTATGTLGIAGKYVNNAVKIFPNPAKEQTAIMLSAGKSGKGTLSVYDLLGNRINRNDVFIKQGSNNLQVPIAEIQPGIYFVELKIENQSAIVRRFVKSR